MRLLHIEDDGGLSPVSFLRNDLIPPYAILSHTRGEDEVTLQDLEEGTAENKYGGYRKLIFYRNCAVEDGLHYLWIDACCIDSTSSVELSEAVNSSYHWLSNSSKCYVHLSDISSQTSALSFRQSKWFTRSWTLQELLAPRSIKFYTADGILLGDEISLLQEIHQITSIPLEVLQHDRLLSECSYEERKSWAENRFASRPEDKVYSILGIFGINMPLLYGEGREKALKRFEWEIEEQKRCRLAQLSPFSRRDPTATSQPTIQNSLLTNDRFRVLTIEPGNFEEMIIGNTQEFSLSDPPPYFALSYVWGQEPELHRMRINGALVPVRPNLFYALQRLRALQTVQTRFWVDSLCIDQKNNIERNAQVGCMAEIYSKASGVYIWLGEEDATSKAAIEFISKVHGKHFTVDERAFKWDGQWWEDYGVKSLSLLLDRSWFRRGWVLQEAAFSTISIIQCGDRQVQMDNFAETLRCIRAKINTEPRFAGLVENRTRFATLSNFVDSPAMRLVDMLPAQGETLDLRMSLETLVYHTTCSETSNERDTIYALLNLAKEAAPLSHSNRSSVLLPDYGKEVLDVYRDFVLHCYNHSGSLDVLCRPWAPTPSSQGQPAWQAGVWGQGSKHLPSWISPRDNLPYGNPLWRLSHRLRGKPLASETPRRTYLAHGGKTPLVITETSPRYLSVKGIWLAEVSKRSQRMANAIVTKECLDVLSCMSPKDGTTPADVQDTIWRTLCANRDAAGNPAPDSFKDALPILMGMANSRHSVQTDVLHEANFMEHVASIDIEELLDADLDKSLEHVRDYMKVVRDTVWNRRAFQATPNKFTSKVLVGLMPQHAHVGDRICILYGCSVPVILRKHENPIEGTYWQLMGDAYVHGFMDGEAISDTPPHILDRMEMVLRIG
jgi:hypothetical protein